jgi:hypothetical protein
MNKSQRRALAIAVVVLIVIYLAFSIYHRHHEASYEQISINKDTGQTVINMPNQEPEKGGTSNQVTALGTSKFLDAGMTTAQFTLTIQLLTTYVHQQLHSQYQQVAILNNGFKSALNNIYAQMRLGNSKILVNLDINYYNLYTVDLKITGPSGTGTTYNYDSGAQTAPQPAQEGVGE